MTYTPCIQERHIVIGLTFFLASNAVTQIDVDI